MDPTFDDLIPAQPAGALDFEDLIPAPQAGAPPRRELNFDDLIPNHGQSWQPLSSGFGAVDSGQAIGEQSARQEAWGGQPRFSPNGPPLTVAPVQNLKLSTPVNSAALDFQPFEQPPLEGFAPAEDGASQASIPYSGLGSGSVFAPGGAGAIGRALMSPSMPDWLGGNI